VTSPFHSIIDPATGLSHHSTLQETSALAGSTTAAGDINATDQRTASTETRQPINIEGLFKVDPPKDSGQLRGPRQPLRGGTYTDEDALTLLNSHFFIAKGNQETAVFRINDDGSATYMQPEQFKLEVQNIFVEVSSRFSTKRMPAEKFWKESFSRHERTIVFKPQGTNNPHEFNLWRGFGVEPRKGWQKQRRLLRHIREVVCRRDRAKFNYLIRYLAWAVQNPDKQAGVIIMLKSRKQGTGKSTLGKVMLDIFGPHGASVDDKDRLLGRFTDWLDTVCFVLAEEILFAGDMKTADKLKSMITADSLQVEGKYRSVRQIPNRLKVLATTNHDHAVAAGARDRRNVVFDVSDAHAGDRAWFDSLYEDLAHGGTSEFLALLQRVQLGGWHPRQILKTADTVEQQRMSGDSISQWAQACIEADGIIGDGAPLQRDLGQWIATKDLQRAYDGYCKQQGSRPANEGVFYRACAEMFGQRKHMPVSANAAAAQTVTTPTTGGNKSRPWGYDVPDGAKWQDKIDERLGIK
jgi:hypothetical protein